MTIYAKQVPPEYQESPLFWDENGPEGIEIFGNRHYKEYTSALFGALPDNLDELCKEWEELQAGRSWYRACDTWAEALDYFAAPEGRPEYTREERKTAWPALLAAWENHNGNDRNKLLCQALELITGRAWDYCTLRGCCQGDWQECIYPVDDWDGDALERLEAEYFNTGTEWIVHDESGAPAGPGDINGFSVYCTAWNDDGIKKEIADAAGGSPEEVKLYKFTGFSRIANYAEVE